MDRLGHPVKVLLLSGGLDSLALAYWKRPQLALTIDYGQRSAAAELEAARRVCAYLDLEHQVIAVNCAPLGSGLLANAKPLKGSPSPEWWPFRNQLLITLALMYLTGSTAQELMLGTVAGDELHADGRAPFFAAVNALAATQEFHPAITAPAIGLTTAELIQRAQVPHGLLLWSHSCQVGDLACGACRGCRKRLDVLQELGLLD